MTFAILGHVTAFVGDKLHTGVHTGAHTGAKRRAASPESERICNGCAVLEWCGLRLSWHLAKGCGDIDNIADFAAFADFADFAAWWGRRRQTPQLALTGYPASGNLQRVFGLDFGHGYWRSFRVRLVAATEMPV
jgi:hypothetical protein